MKRGTPEHPKTVALARALGVHRVVAVGTLELLWHWTARYAARGDVGRYPDETIAEGVLWEGEPTKLVSALVSAGWLDECPVHRLIVHDWSQHADDATKKALQRNGLDFAFVSRQRRTKSERVRTVAAVEALAVAPAVAVARAQPEPVPEPSLAEPPAAPTDLGPRPNPLIPTTEERKAWEARWHVAVTLLSEAQARDPAEVAREHSLYEGARTAKLNPASMTNERLMNTVLSLERALAAERTKHTQSAATKVAERTLAARAAEPLTVDQVKRHVPSLSAAFASFGGTFEDFCAVRNIPNEVAHESGLRTACAAVAS